MPRARPADRAGAPSIWRVIRRNAATVAAAMVLAKLLGFFEKQVLASYFGTGPQAEAYFVMTGLTLAVASLARELTEPVMLPTFVANLSRPGRQGAAWALFRAFFLSALLAAALLAGVAVARPAAVLGLLAPGLSPEAVAVATRLFTFAAGGTVFLAGAAVTQVALNGAERFGRAAAGDLAYRLVLLLACLGASLGGLGVVALAGGVTVGALVKLSGQLLWLPGRAGSSTLRARPRAGDLSLGGAELWPIVLGLVLGQVADLAETRCASLVAPGALAARLYARKIVDLPILLAPYVLSVAVFPHLSRLAAARDQAGVGRVLAPAVRWSVVGFVPLALVMSVFAEPLVMVLLQRGRFDAAATAATAAALAAYAVGLPAFALEALLVPVFFAARDTRTPALIGGLGVALQLAGLGVLGTRWGTAGIAATLVLGKVVKVVVLGWLLARRQISLGPGLLRDLMVVTAAALPAGAVAVSLRSLFPGRSQGRLVDLATLAGATALTGVVYGALYLLIHRVARGRRPPRPGLTFPAGEPGQRPPGERIEKGREDGR